MKLRPSGARSSVASVVRRYSASCHVLALVHTFALATRRNRALNAQLAACGTNSGYGRSCSPPDSITAQLLTTERTGGSSATTSARFLGRAIGRFGRYCANLAAVWTLRLHFHATQTR
jgi:hypothetical protein